MGRKQPLLSIKLRIWEIKILIAQWIGCQIYGTTNTGDERESDLGKKAPKFEIKIKINITKAHSLSIEDTIEDDGCLGVKDARNIKYKWQRSSDGVNDWQDIPESRDDTPVLYDHERNLMFLVM